MGALPRAMSSKVYPRVCGGTGSVVLVAASPRGLSPRVRGNPLHGGESACPRGSIPACAGEPADPAPACVCAAVYPRVCGGTNLAALGSRASEGLSPRVRGNPPATAARDRFAWSIPACAGEPQLADVRDDVRGVYPRVCGGTRSSRRVKARLWGLSPRVRGNPGARVGGVPAAGSIPACAGEPCRCPKNFRPKKVYPRVCGGTRHCRYGRPPDAGLSPRVRGNRGGFSGAYQQAGSIPACAGEPLGFCAAGRAGEVYPRVCGGTAARTGAYSSSRGLSPRVRGNPS